MVEVQETVLPGVGVRHDFLARSGKRVGVLTHKDGRRELFVQDGTNSEPLTLSPPEAERMADLLCGFSISPGLSTLVQGVQGLSIDWLRVQSHSAAAGRAIGELGTEAWGGVIVVAVLREGQVHAGPGAAFVLHSNDTVVVLGTAAGMARATRAVAS